MIASSTPLGWRANLGGSQITTPPFAGAERLQGVEDVGGLEPRLAQVVDHGILSGQLDAVDRAVDPQYRGGPPCRSALSANPPV